MSDKAAKIKEMIEMQKKFIEYEHNNGVDPKDYFKPDAGHELDGYRQKYRDLAMEVVDLAHAEAGSSLSFNRLQLQIRPLISGLFYVWKKLLN